MGLQLTVVTIETVVTDVTIATDGTVVTNVTVQCIAGNFRLEKIFAFFTQARRGRKFFQQIILLSENFVMLKFYMHKFLHMAAKLY